MFLGGGLEHFQLHRRLWLQITICFIWQTSVSYLRSAPLKHKEPSGGPSVGVTHTTKVFRCGYFMTHLKSVDHGMRNEKIGLMALQKKNRKRKLSALISTSPGKKHLCRAALSQRWVNLDLGATLNNKCSVWLVRQMSSLWETLNDFNLLIFLFRCFQNVTTKVGGISFLEALELQHCSWSLSLLLLKVITAWVINMNIIYMNKSTICSMYKVGKSTFWFVCRTVTNIRRHALAANQRLVNIGHMCVNEFLSAHLECKCMRACKSFCLWRPIPTNLSPGNAFHETVWCNHTKSCH